MTVEQKDWGGGEINIADKDQQMLRTGKRIGEKESTKLS